MKNHDLRMHRIRELIRPPDPPDLPRIAWVDTEGGITIDGNPATQADLDALRADPGATVITWVPADYQDEP